MSYIARTRAQAEAYFAGANNCEVAYMNLDEKYKQPYPVGEYDAYMAGWKEFKMYNLPELLKERMAR